MVTGWIGGCAASSWPPSRGQEKPPLSSRCANTPHKGELAWRNHMVIRRNQIVISGNHVVIRVGTSRLYISVVSRLYLGHISAIYLGRISAVSRLYLGRLLLYQLAQGRALLEFIGLGPRVGEVALLCNAVKT